MNTDIWLLADFTQAKLIMYIVSCIFVYCIFDLRKIHKNKKYNHGLNLDKVGGGGGDVKEIPVQVLGYLY